MHHFEDCRRRPARHGVGQRRQPGAAVPVGAVVLLVVSAGAGTAGVEILRDVGMRWLRQRCVLAGAVVIPIAASKASLSAVGTVTVAVFRD